MNLTAYNRWAASTLGGACKEVEIIGGTINTYSSQLSGISCSADGSIKIIGGNVLSKGGQFVIAKCIDARYNIEETTVTDGTNQLYVTPIFLSGVKGDKKVEELDIDGITNYGKEDIYTFNNDSDDAGVIYLYLPKGSRNITITVNGKTFSGTVETTEDGDATTLG